MEKLMQMIFSFIFQMAIVSILGYFMIKVNPQSSDTIIGIFGGMLVGFGMAKASDVFGA